MYDFRNLGKDPKYSLNITIQPNSQQFVSARCEELVRVIVQQVVDDTTAFITLPVQGTVCVRYVGKVIMEQVSAGE